MVSAKDERADCQCHVSEDEDDPTEIKMAETGEATADDTNTVGTVERSRRKNGNEHHQVTYLQYDLLLFALERDRVTVDSFISPWARCLKKNMTSIRTAIHIRHAQVLRILLTVLLMLVLARHKKILVGVADAAAFIVAIHNHNNNNDVIGSLQFSKELPGGGGWSQGRGIRGGGEFKTSTHTHVLARSWCTKLQLSSNNNINWSNNGSCDDGGNDVMLPRDAGPFYAANGRRCLFVPADVTSNNNKQHYSENHHHHPHPPLILLGGMSQTTSSWEGHLSAL
jgi:hypothetical protein